MKKETQFSLKDMLFNRPKVAYLASLFAAVHPEFDDRSFIEATVAAFDTLELKERIAHIATVLAIHLPDDFDAALALILGALPPPLDPDQSDDDYGDFIFAPLSSYVVEHGCTDEHLEVSLAALREITKRFSAEDAIRTFINAYPDRTMEFLADCATDTNYHVRRLASEGSWSSSPNTRCEHS